MRDGDGTNAEMARSYEQVPLSHFIEHPFQNLTYESAALIGSVHLSLDYTVPVEHIRAKATEIVEASQLWDGRVVNLQVVEATERAIQLRVLASARRLSRCVGPSLSREGEANRFPSERVSQRVAEIPGRISLPDPASADRGSEPRAA